MERAAVTTVPIEHEVLVDLLDTKLLVLTGKINAILQKWQQSSIEAFLEGAANGTIEEAEPDAISLTNLLARREAIYELKQRYHA